MYCSRIEDDSVNRDNLYSSESHVDLVYTLEAWAACRTLSDQSWSHGFGGSYFAWCDSV